MGANTAPSLESRGPNFAVKRALNIINTFILGVVYLSSSPHSTSYDAHENFLQCKSSWNS